MTILYGTFNSISKDHRYVSTSNGVYDLKSEFYPVGHQYIDNMNFENSINEYLSEDGRFLIKDKEEKFELIDAKFLITSATLAITASIMYL